MRRHLPTATTVAVLSILLAACGGQAATLAPTADETPVAGGRLVVATPSDVDSWNEYLSRNASTRTVLRRIWLPLAERGATGEFVPRLAESWEFADDGLSLRVRLRPHTWSDGTPLTAADVRFTWQAQTADAVPWVGRPAKRRIVTVEAPDELTAVFRFDGIYPFRLADAFEGGILPRHIHGTIPFDEWPTHDWTAEAAVGSGPFVLAAHRPADRFTLRRNDLALADDRPFVDEVVARIVPDATALLTLLQTGAANYVERIAPRAAASLDSRDDFAVIAYDAHDVTSIGWNHERPPFDDPLLRRALTLAVDRDALVEELLYGYGRVAALPVTEALGAEAGIAAWPHDPEHARELLAERGYAVRRADGSESDGRRLEIELMTNAGNSVREAAAVKIQEQLARVGVSVAVRTLEMRTLGGRITGGDFDAYLLGIVAEARDLPALVGTRNLPPTGANYVRWSSAEVDAVLAEIEAATELQALTPAYAELVRLIHRDQPMTHLFASQRVAAHDSSVHGVVIAGPTDPWGALHRWWVDTP